MATSEPKRRIDAAPMVTRMVYYYLGQAAGMMERAREAVDEQRWPGKRPRHVDQLLEEINAWQAAVAKLVAESLRGEREGGD